MPLTLAQNLHVAQKAIDYVKSLNITSLAREGTQKLSFEAGTRLTQVREQDSLEFHQRRNYLDNLGDDPSPWASKKASKAKKVGNCGELVNIAYTFILKHYGHLFIQHKTDVEILYTFIEGEAALHNHSVLALGRDLKGTNIDDPSSWGENAVICDPLFEACFPAENFLGNLKMHTNTICDDLPGSSEYCMQTNTYENYIGRACDHMIGSNGSLLHEDYYGKLYPLEIYKFKLREILNEFGLFLKLERNPDSGNYSNSLIDVLKEIRSIQEFRIFCNEKLVELLPPTLDIPTRDAIYLKISRLLQKISRVHTISNIFDNITPPITFPVGVVAPLSPTLKREDVLHHAFLEFQNKMNALPDFKALISLLNNIGYESFIQHEQTLNGFNTHIIAIEKQKGAQTKTRDLCLRGFKTHEGNTTSIAFFVACIVYLSDKPLSTEIKPQLEQYLLRILHNFNEIHSTFNHLFKR